jgi:hypothetical protein
MEIKGRHLPGLICLRVCHDHNTVLAQVAQVCLLPCRCGLRVRIQSSIPVGLPVLLDQDAGCLGGGYQECIEDPIHQYENG